MASSSYVMGDLAEQYENFQIDDEEEGVLIEGEADGDEQTFDDRWCLVGKFLTGRSIDFDAMRHLMASLWQPGKGVYVKELEANLYLFQFYHEIDIQMVIDGSPWTFNKVPLIFHRLKSGENPRMIHLHKLDMWVQIHNLKTGFMMDKVVRSAGSYIGTYVKSDPKNFVGVWRDYLRVRTTVDIEKPLKRRMKLYKENGEWIWAMFQYEHLPTFCFICGIIGHSERFCAKRFDHDIDQIVKPYGIGMKAQMRRRNYQIGSQWLRSGTEQQVAVETHDDRRLGEEGLADSAAKIIEVDPSFQGNGINPGGDDNGKNLSIKSGAVSSQRIGKVNPMQSAGNVNVGVDGEDISKIILDSKRRRMEGGNIGENADVADGACVMMENEVYVGDGPKNMSKVGLGSQAHPSL
ncbi:hypothetical protein CsatB_008008 [Cannabis sativa]|uniref:uncharacterized protein LOC115724003 n=1 Tax=Cannabis sativa TaxID=3483 RepID=UPI0011DF0E07|nr:uncharacterized protein LOC115724003 [Cannabis sativa]